MLFDAYCDSNLDHETTRTTSLSTGCPPPYALFDLPMYTDQQPASLARHSSPLAAEEQRLRRANYSKRTVENLIEAGLVVPDSSTREPASRRASSKKKSVGFKVSVKEISMCETSTAFRLPPLAVLCLGCKASMADDSLLCLRSPAKSRCPSSGPKFGPTSP